VAPAERPEAAQLPVLQVPRLQVQRKAHQAAHRHRQLRRRLRAARPPLPHRQQVRRLLRPHRRRHRYQVSSR